MGNVRLRNSPQRLFNLAQRLEERARTAPEPLKTDLLAAAAMRREELRKMVRGSRPEEAGPVRYIEIMEMGRQTKGTILDTEA